MASSKQNKSKTQPHQPAGDPQLDVTAAKPSRRKRVRSTNRAEMSVTSSGGSDAITDPGLEVASDSVTPLSGGPPEPAPTVVLPELVAPSMAAEPAPTVVLPELAAPSTATEPLVPELVAPSTAADPLVPEPVAAEPLAPRAAQPATSARRRGLARPINWRSTSIFLLILLGTVGVGIGVAVIAASFKPLIAAAAIVGVAVGIRFATRPFYALMVTMLFIPMDALDRYFPPSLSAVKVMSLITIGCFALYWLVFSENKRLLNGPMPKLILLFITVGLIGSFFAYYPSESLDAVSRFFRLFLLVLLVRNLVDTPQRARWLILALMIGVCISAAVGLHDLMTTHLKNFRPMGLTQQPNKFGNDTAQMVPVALAFMWSARSRWMRALYAAAAGLLIVAVVISLSRGSLIGLIAVMPLLIWRLGGRHRWTIFAAIILVLVVAFPFIPSRYYDRFSTVSDPNEDFSVMRRQTYLIFAEKKFLERPLIGIGLSNFEELYVQSEYRILLNEHDKTKGRPAHNMYMHVTVETGVFGIALFLTILFWAWRDLQRSQKGFAAQGDLLSMRLAQGLEVSFICFLILCLFGSRQYEEFPWLICALSGALLQLSQVGARGGEKVHAPVQVSAPPLERLPAGSA